MAFNFSSVVEALSFAMAPERQVLGVTAFLLLFFSGPSTFVWFGQFAKPGAACAGAVIYVIAPDHLTVDQYERAPSQNSRHMPLFALIPLLFLALRLYIGGQKAVFFLPSFTYCALILCHIPTTLRIRKASNIEKRQVAPCPTLSRAGFQLGCLEATDTQSDGIRCPRGSRRL